jgi:tripartite-type tricarboxylate transporter receptor subunit TctC
MAEAAIAGMVSGSWQGIFVPAGTPRAIVDKLHAAIVEALGSAETRQRLVDSGVSVETSRTPDDFTAFVNAEIVRWGREAKESGATVD